MGGGLGLPSESSTRGSVRFSSCSSRKARSSRMRWMERRARWMRDVSRSLLLSISPMRFLISLHFWRYDSSTDAGSAGVGPDGDLAVCGWGLAGGRGQRRVVRGGGGSYV